MRRLIFLFALLSTFVLGQTPNGSRKAWTDTLRVSYNNQFIDILDLVRDSLDVVADTSELKQYTGKSRVFLKQISSNTATGAGGFILKTSGEPDGVTTFSAISGYWVREEVGFIDHVKAEWAGAIGDSTTDNENAFNKAQLSALKIGHGVVKFGPGYFDFEGNARVLAGVTIEGSGDSTIFTSDNPTQYILAAPNYEVEGGDNFNVTIRKIKFKRDYVISNTAPTGFQGGIALQPQNLHTFGTVIIENCTFENIKMENVQIWGARLGIIRNNVFRNTSAWINVSGCANSVISGNQLYNVFFGIEADGRASFSSAPGLNDSTSTLLIYGNDMREVWYYGIQAHGGVNVTIANNNIIGRFPSSSAAAEHNGIFIDLNSNYVLDKYLIANNNISYMRGDGIQFKTDASSDPRPNQLSILGNSISNNGLMAIRIVNHSSLVQKGLVIGENTIFNNLSGTNPSTNSYAITPIHIQRCDSLVLRNNVIRTPTMQVRGDPVYLLACTDPVIYGNDFRSRSGIRVNADQATYDSNWIFKDNLGVSVFFDSETPTGSTYQTQTPVSSGTMFGSADTLFKILMSSGGDSLWFIVNSDTFISVKK